MEDDGGGGGGLSRLVPKPLKPFKSTDEYVYAMKEDLAYWFNGLYGTDLSADTLLQRLEDGVLLCRHVNGVCGYIRRAAESATGERRGGGSAAAAASEVAYRYPVRPKTFQARDNVANFIAWLRSNLGMRDTVLFETDDLVLGKNEKNVVLSLLELARRGARYGVPAPLLVQLEQEIERADSSTTCSSGDDLLRRQQQLQRGPDNQTLDELVRSSLSRCTCPSQFPLIQIAPGKYKFGDNQTTVFVRVLRSHVMIRVGGGWDTLERYLDKHDPCRCKALGHRRGSLPNVEKPLKVLPSKFPVADGIPGDRPTSVNRPSDSMRRKIPQESQKKMAPPPSLHKGFYSTLNLRELGEQTLRRRHGRSGSNLSLFAGPTVVAASCRNQQPRSGRSTPRDPAPPPSSLVVSRDQSGRHRVSESSSNPASPGHVQRSFSPVPFSSYAGGGSSRPCSPARRRLNRVARDTNHRRSTSEPCQVLSTSLATAEADDGGNGDSQRDRSAVRAWPALASPRKDKVQSARPTRIPQPVSQSLAGVESSPDADAGAVGAGSAKWSYSSAMRKVDSGVEMTSDDSDTSHV